MSGYGGGGAGGGTAGATAVATYGGTSIQQTGVSDTPGSPASYQDPYAATQGADTSSTTPSTELTGQTESAPSDTQDNTTTGDGYADSKYGGSYGKDKTSGGGAGSAAPSASGGLGGGNNGGKNQALPVSSLLGSMLSGVSKLGTSVANACGFHGASTPTTYVDNPSQVPATTVGNLLSGKSAGLIIIVIAVIALLLIAND